MSKSIKIKKIDCLGDICPIPIMKLSKNLKHIEDGEACMLITDHSCTLTSVTDFCKNHKLMLSADEVMNGVWEITINK